MNWTLHRPPADTSLSSRSPHDCPSSHPALQQVSCCLPGSECHRLEHSSCSWTGFKRTPATCSASYFSHQCCIKLLGIPLFQFHAWSQHTCHCPWPGITSPAFPGSTLLWCVVRTCLPVPAHNRDWHFTLITSQLQVFTHYWARVKIVAMRCLCSNLPSWKTPD